jgi:hypothetical protein
VGNTTPNLQAAPAADNVTLLLLPSYAALSSRSCQLLLLPRTPAVLLLLLLLLKRRDADSMGVLPARLYPNSSCSPGWSNALLTGCSAAAAAAASPLLLPAPLSGDTSKPAAASVLLLLLLPDELEVGPSMSDAE